MRMYYCEKQWAANWKIWLLYQKICVSIVLLNKELKLGGLEDKEEEEEVE